MKLLVWTVLIAATLAMGSAFAYIVDDSDWCWRFRDVARERIRETRAIEREAREAAREGREAAREAREIAREQISLAKREAARVRYEARREAIRARIDFERELRETRINSRDRDGFRSYLRRWQ
jgi:predicted membrane chloride channel (bestrophin family)